MHFPWCIIHLNSIFTDLTIHCPTSILNIFCGAITLKWWTFLLIKIISWTLTRWKSFKHSFVVNIWQTFEIIFDTSIYPIPTRPSIDKQIKWLFSWSKTQSDHVHPGISIRCNIHDQQILSCYIIIRVIVFWVIFFFIWPTFPIFQWIVPRNTKFFCFFNPWLVFVFSCLILLDFFCLVHLLFFYSLWFRLFRHCFIFIYFLIF